jgi:lipopolysaccharide biosynthesis glycosyltransferase
MLAVVTVAIGAEFREIAALTHPFMADYASRIGADFVSLHGPVENPYLEKLRLGDYLCLYDRILFLDSDVIVRPDCPDLFELVPADCFGAWLASNHSPRFDPEIAQLQQQLGNISWQKTYFNSGVMVVSRQHREAFASVTEPHHEPFDQGLLNYRVQKLGYRIFDIGHRFNHTGVASQTADRFQSHIIHFAGQKQQRANAIRADLRHLRYLGYIRTSRHRNTP